MNHWAIQWTNVIHQIKFIFI